MPQFYFINFFTDPILRAPTLGCMLMCIAASLVGVFAFLRKESLLGEALSHAAYPGVILGVIAAGLLEAGNQVDIWLPFFVLSGAFLSALFGLRLIHALRKNLKMSSDSALCLVLSSCFGIGVTLASRLQFTHTSLYQQAQVYLYGQVATMTDFHIFVYGALCLLVILAFLCFYKELQVISFDRAYAKSLGIQVSLLDSVFFCLVVLAIIIGIRSVGIVLMSAMLIAPAITARQYTHKLPILLLLSALFGALSGFLGNYFSVTISEIAASRFSTKLSLPTGPMIVIAAACLCILSLLFAPKRGLLLRVLRIGKFRFKCTCENILKSIWRLEPNQKTSLEKIANTQDLHPLYFRFIIWRLARQGWIEHVDKRNVKLTQGGQMWAQNIVRLHRLWEVYLAEYLNMGTEKVHCNAEEMEHILTPEIERQLLLLLNNPKEDPHRQPIPSNSIGIS